MAGPNPYSASAISSAVQDLGINNDTRQKTQAELEEMKRRKKLMGSQAPLGSASAAALMGTPY